MSTASTSRAALNSDEFPVLLRLPDLNAPVWTPTSAAAMALDLSPPPMTTTFRLDGGAAAVTAPAPAESPVVTNTVASAEPISLPADRAQRVSRGEMPNFAQWPLVKQLTTGGVLVGGLALTYLMVMGGSPPTKPDQATAPLVAPVPVIDPTPVPVGPGKKIDYLKVVGEDEKSVSERGISPVPPPPQFSDRWDIPAPSPAPSEARIASNGNLPGAYQNIEVVTDKPVVDDLRGASPELSPPSVVPPAESRNEAARYEGRIGPGGASSAMQGSSGYPTTDPSTYMYRPSMETPPDAGRPGMARLDGTINPPPRR
ncbi:MAG TPA: hypothetical protein VL096_09155 [Pirellulaceae bacterium]|nr:hypothetical protein [Pirellulaceae bacterium]